MWPYPWTHVGTPSHLGHMDRVAATMPSQAHAGAAQEAPDIGQWEGQDIPLVSPSSCIVKGGIPSSRRYLPTYLSTSSSDPPLPADLIHKATTKAKAATARQAAGCPPTPTQQPGSTPGTHFTQHWCPQPPGRGPPQDRTGPEPKTRPQTKMESRTTTPPTTAPPRPPPTATTSPTPPTPPHTATKIRKGATAAAPDAHPP